MADKQTAAEGEQLIGEGPFFGATLPGPLMPIGRIGRWLRVEAWGLRGFTERRRELRRGCLGLRNRFLGSASGGSLTCIVFLHWNTVIQTRGAGKRLDCILVV